MKFFDSHCHLNDEKILLHLDEVVFDAKEAGVDAMVCIGYDLASSKKAIEIANRYEGVYAAIGFHPENIEGQNKEDSLREIRLLAKEDRVIAIGEIGLDYYWYKDPEVRRRQKPWFIAQIELANELNLPVSIHARDATRDVYEILRDHPLKAGGVLHCYSGSVESLREFAKLGLYFGFDGPITFKNAITPKECVKECPLDRLLVETDSPYLAPTPFRGKENGPKYIPYIVSEMAKIKEMDEEVLRQNLADNFTRLFRVKQ